MSERDPTRIPKIMDQLERVWEQNPELRLLQLLISVIRPSEPAPDLFYVEDEVLLDLLEVEMNKHREIT